MKRIFLSALLLIGMGNAPTILAMEGGSPKEDVYVWYTPQATPRVLQQLRVVEAIKRQRAESVGLASGFKNPAVGPEVVVEIWDGAINQAYVKLLTEDSAFQSAQEQIPVTVSFAGKVECVSKFLYALTANGQSHEAVIRAYSTVPDLQAKVLKDTAVELMYDTSGQ